MGRLEGKVALITGASRGTGAVTARLFVEEGACVVLADVLDEPGHALAKELGDAALFQRLDVTQEGDWQRAVEVASERFGSLDVLVNNAAVLLLAALADTSRDDFERVLAVNLLGPFLGIRICADALARSGRGSIVNISSTDGVKGMNGVAAYASSKWGLRGLTRVAAIELGRRGIRVNAVCPEAGNTEMTAPFVPTGIDLEEVTAKMMAQILKPAPGREKHADRVLDVARMALFLASDESGSCTGADFLVDTGILAGNLQPGAPGA